MEFRKFIENENWKLWIHILAVAIPLSGLYARQVIRDHHDARIYINGAGDFDPLLRDWEAPRIFNRDGRVLMDLGESIESMDLLFLFGPPLRLYPQAKSVTMTWTVHCPVDCGNIDDENGVIYNRESGELFFLYSYNLNKTPISKIELVATGVDDEMIFQLIKNGGQFIDLAKKNLE